MFDHIGDITNLLGLLKTYWIFILGGIVALWVLGSKNVWQGLRRLWTILFGGSDERGLRRYILAIIVCLLAFWGLKQAAHRCPDCPPGQGPQTIIAPSDPAAPVTLPGKAVTIVVYKDVIDLGPWAHNLHTTKVRVMKNKDTVVVLRKGLVFVPECSIGYLAGDDMVRPMLGARILSWDRVGIGAGVSPKYVAAYLESNPFDSVPNLTFGVGPASRFDSIQNIGVFGKAGVQWK